MITKSINGASVLVIAVSAGLFWGGTAFAGGSIGGECCADLEERVAELEATTARKGNRRVSLTVSGHVNKALLYQDFNDATVARVPARSADTLSVSGYDGELQIIDNPLSQSRFRLVGQANISSDLYAGYHLEFGVTHDASPLVLRYNDLYIGSKTYGKLSIGHGNAATEGIAEIDLSGTGLAGSSANISGLINLDGDRTERVRYDTPTIAGFVLSASWEEDEDYDVAVRFGANLGDFTFAAGVGYSDKTAALENVVKASGPCGPGGSVVHPCIRADGASVETVSGSLSVLHNPTGVNLTVAAGQRDYDFDGNAFGIVAGGVNNQIKSSYDADFIYVKLGVKRKVFAAGETAISIDYHNENTFMPKYGSASIMFDTPIAGVDLEQVNREKFGVQFVQKIDAAETELYASFWTAWSDFENAGGIAGDALEEDGVMIGARVSF